MTIASQATVSIDRLNCPVSEEVIDQVLLLVSDNVTSLCLTHPPADHPRFEAYRAALMLEVRTYLEMAPPHRIELVTATSRESLLGFTLCGLPLSGSSHECGIYYMAVAKAERGNGLMSLMMKDIISRYTSAALSCDVALVPRYERYGFRCEYVRHRQVVMFLGNPVENTPVLSADDLMNHPSVVFERQKAEAKYSSHEIDRADRAFKKRMKADEEKAKRFIKNRLSR